MEIKALISKWRDKLISPVSIAPLVLFRLLFGAMMMFALIRFWSNGWIEKFYLEPLFFFSYYGFEFVKPLGAWTYLIFAISFLSALGILLGYRYRLATILFFLSFTYIELMDKTTYLNHYYFVSLVSFLLIFLPAHTYFSVDAYLKRTITYSKIPYFYQFSIQLLLSIVYFYAGLAKLNSDWLLSALPLRIWLPSHSDWPILGSLFQMREAHFLLSWAGMLFDLTVPFLLFNHATRFIGYTLVIIFHVFTAMLFPIGIFPFVMIISTLIFFDSSFHEKIISNLIGLIQYPKLKESQIALNWQSTVKNKILIGILSLFFFIQLLFPFRYLLYPGELFWTEEGYRFSWRVMLIEKTGLAQFKIVNKQSGKSFYVNNGDFLSPIQEKQMSTQPDFILQYAHFLADYFESQGQSELEVYVDSHIALNGRMSRRYIDPNVNLINQKESFKHKDWILPFDDKIFGF